jgi:hypothetical protein
LKVLVPEVAPRVEEWNHISVSRVNTGEVGAFVEVAAEATESKVVRAISAAVFPGGDVVDGKSLPMSSLGKMAVFAALLGTVTDELAQGVVHWRSRGREMLPE